MARFNGPAPGAGQRAQQGYPQQPRQASPQPPRTLDPYAHEQGLSHYPEAQAYDNGFPPRQQPAPADQQGRYAPPYDPYAAPEPRTQSGFPPVAADPYRRPPETPPFEPQQAYAPPGYEADPFARQEPSFGAPPPAPPPQFQPAADLRGTVHDQWGQPAGRNAMGYDVGGYETADPAAFAPAPTHAAAPGWGNESATYAGEQGYGYEMAEPSGGALTEQSEIDEDEYEDEEPRGKGRMLLIAGALVGAIGIGGALAFGYKAFIGTGPDGVPPIVKNDAAPSKMKPADPGGKQFAHTDSKIMGRLSDTGSVTTAATTPATESEGGTRKVQTVVIGRDGSVSAPATQPPAPTSAPVVSVPGMTVIDGFGATPAARDAQRPVVVNPPASPPPAAAPPAEKPVTIAKVAPTAAPAATAPQITQAKPAAPVAEKKPVEKKVAAVQPAATAPAAAAPAPRPSGAGYVAVLTSVPASSSSRMEALKQFADMQQRYGSVLQSKTPDVTEANLGAKGTYHRLVVGPPGSREQASALCGQLKTAGYSGCWVTAY